MNTATDTATAVVKEKDVLDLSEAKELPCLSPEAVAAQKT